MKYVGKGRFSKEATAEWSTCAFLHKCPLSRSGCVEGARLRKVHRTIASPSLARHIGYHRFIHTCAYRRCTYPARTVLPSLETYVCCRDERVLGNANCRRSGLKQFSLSSASSLSSTLDRRALVISHLTTGKIRESSVKMFLPIGSCRVIAGLKVCSSSCRLAGTYFRPLRRFTGFYRSRRKWEHWSKGILSENSASIYNRSRANAR